MVSKMFRKKGQFFLIAAIFILMGIIIIKDIIGFFEIGEERRFHESTFLNKNLKNIKNEYRYLIGLSSMQSDVNSSGIIKLWNFTNLIRDSINSKILYVYIFTNGTNQKYSITVGNFLNDRINVLINVTNSTIPSYFFGLMNDKTNNTKEFQSNINDTINIILTYDTQTEQTIEKFSINPSKNSVTCFFDITLYNDNLLVRMKDIYNRTW